MFQTLNFCFEVVFLLLIKLTQHETDWLDWSNVGFEFLVRLKLLKLDFIHLQIFPQ